VLPSWELGSKGGPLLRHVPARPLVPTGMREDGMWSDAVGEGMWSDAVRVTDILKRSRRPLLSFFPPFPSSRNNLFPCLPARRILVLPHNPLALSYPPYAPFARRCPCLVCPLPSLSCPPRRALPARCRPCLVRPAARRLPATVLVLSAQQCAARRCHRCLAPPPRCVPPARCRPCLVRPAARRPPAPVLVLSTVRSPARSCHVTTVE